MLKKFPEHGETLAMKGLILNCMERKAEAYELVRKGVKLDIKSHVCWHVYALLYRSDREYTQAIKCWPRALRHDKDNIQILRDLSMLQVQMRDLKGFVETRQQVLTLKPTNRNNWFSFAVAQHLRGRHVAAKNIVESYEKTLEGTPENEYEHGEMLLYKNLLLEESGDLPRALEHLEECESRLVDKLFYKHKRAELLLQLERYSEAARGVPRPPQAQLRALCRPARPTPACRRRCSRSDTSKVVACSSGTPTLWVVARRRGGGKLLAIPLYAGAAGGGAEVDPCKRLPLDCRAAGRRLRIRPRRLRAPVRAQGRALDLQQPEAAVQLRAEARADAHRSSTAGSRRSRRRAASPTRRSARSRRR